MICPIPDTVVPRSSLPDFSLDQPVHPRKLFVALGPTTKVAAEESRGIFVSS